MFPVLVLGFHFAFIESQVGGSFECSKIHVCFCKSKQGSRYLLHANH